MNIYVLDHNFRRQHIIDIYESLIWTDRYGESGDFELYLPTSQEAIDILQKDMYLSIDTSDYIKIIEDIEITSNNEDGKKLKVTGRTLDSILDRRIIWGLTELNVSLQDGIEELLNKNLINPDDPNRKIDNFVMKKSTDSAITDLMIDAQYFYRRTSWRNTLSTPIKKSAGSARISTGTSANIWADAFMRAFTWAKIPTSRT